ncbi:MAG: metalloregulator ArsR/SmtB family transcription factor [Elusimicrobiota bacterium]
MEKFTNVFRALSDKTRLRILHLLTFSKKELCICEIMDSLKLAQYNISKHIRELKLTGLVKERKEGRFVFYSSVKHKDSFSKNIVKSVESIDNPVFLDDNSRLKKRLFLRKNDKPAGFICISKRCR